MNRISILILNTLLLLANMLLPQKSVATSPRNCRPTPTDTAISVKASVSGNFTSLVTKKQRNLDLDCWIASFGPGEEFNFDQLASRAFSRLQLPEGDGWGYFRPTGDYFTFKLNIVDTLNRLRYVKLYEVGTDKLVKKFDADWDDSSIALDLTRDAFIRDYRADLIGPNGKLLISLAIDLGKYDKIQPLIVHGGFDPGLCTYTGQQSLGHIVKEKIGDKLVQKIFSLTPTSRIVEISYDFINDDSSTFPIRPNLSNSELFKQLSDQDLNQGLAGFLGNPKDFPKLYNQLAPLTTTDITAVIQNIDVPPYSKGKGLWTIEMRGESMGIVGVPYERFRAGANIVAIEAAIPGVAKPGRKYLSQLIADALNRWLQNPENERLTSIHRGEMSAWGDVNALQAKQIQSALVGQKPIK